jgi:hypothetical protein
VVVVCVSDTDVEGVVGVPSGDGVVVVVVVVLETGSPCGDDAPARLTAGTAMDIAARATAHNSQSGKRVRSERRVIASFVPE